MDSFLKTNKNLVIFISIFLIVIPLLGFKFLISLISNVLLLFFLIPLLLFLILLISLNSIKSKVNTCNKCGLISIGSSETCMNCGADLGNPNIKENQIMNNPSERTIEVKAEEVK